MAMHIEFQGAARTVTGSMHVVEVNGQRLLLDCGLYQGRRAEADALNRSLPFDPRQLDAVVLSHAHVDHCGNLPSLVRAGFRGRIYCTAATRDLAACMLMDSARLQENDLDYLNRVRRRQGQPPVAPLYTEADVPPVLKRMVSLGYGEVFEPSAGVRAHFVDAGHILGSASVVLDLTADGQTRRLLFSGDVGRPDLPILRSPETADGVDYLVMESTYGDRLHDHATDALDQLEGVVRETYDAGGVLLIPAFALGRAQELVYRLNQLWEAGRLPPIDVFVDSPLAADVTQVFRLHPECYDDEMRQAVLSEGDHDPLGFKKLRIIRSADQSKQLNDLARPAVIISPSGMCEGGRVLHHLRRRLGDRRTTVMFVGYQGENTLGRKLLDGVSPVRIFDEEHEVRARILRADSYSAHADRDELLAWFDQVQATGTLRRVFLVHGEAPAMDAFATALESRSAPRVDTPGRGMRFRLD
jgi:metallo-beta-lactamase family protein